MLYLPALAQHAEILECRTQEFFTVSGKMMVYYGANNASGSNSLIFGCLRLGGYEKQEGQVPLTGTLPFTWGGIVSNSHQGGTRAANIALAKDLPI